VRRIASPALFVVCGIVTALLGVVGWVSLVSIVTGLASGAHEEPLVLLLLAAVPLAGLTGWATWRLAPG
jgi:hypothetical protein